MNEWLGRQDRWQELTRSECFELLARERLGRVAVIDDLGPVVFPMPAENGDRWWRPAPEPGTP